MSDIEVRVRELEIASSVHSINTKQLEANTLELVQDIKSIKESMNIGIGVNSTLKILGLLLATTLLSVLGWISITLTSNSHNISKLTALHVHPGEYYERHIK